jgi:putative ABC transport system permease protein
VLIFSIKNAFRKKSTAILASLGVGFGLMLVFVLGSFSAGVSTQFSDNLQKTVGQVTLTEKLKRGSESQIPLDFPNQLLEYDNISEHLIRYTVESEAPIIFTFDYWDDIGEDGNRLIVKGINLTLDQAWEGPSTKIIEGRVFKENELEVIVDSRLSRVAEFNVSVGQTLELFLNPGGTETFEVKIVGVYEQEDNGAPDFVPRDYYLYMDIGSLWTILEENDLDTDYYSSITLNFDSETSEETTKYVNFINNRSEEGEFDPTFISAVSVGAFFESIEESLGIITAFTSIIGFITALAGGMAIIVTQLMSVTSRLKEFAILKSTGWKNRHIFLNVVYESLTLGFLGAIIGLGLGFVLILLLGSGASPFGAASATVSTDAIVQVVVYALSLGIIGGLYPGIKAARVRPVVVLKGG